MLEELLAHLVDEKIDCKKYKEMAEETQDMQLKQILMEMSDDEHNHYKMLKSYLSSKMRE